LTMLHPPILIFCNGTIRECNDMVTFPQIEILVLQSYYFPLMGVD
jgi:hypothetical protein